MRGDRRAPTASQTTVYLAPSTTVTSHLHPDVDGGETRGVLQVGSNLAGTSLNGGLAAWRAVQEQVDRLVRDLEAAIAPRLLAVAAAPTPPDASGGATT